MNNFEKSIASIEAELEKFKKSIASIEAELKKLKEINYDLAQDNEILKKQLAKKNNSEVAFVSVDDAFRSIHTTSDGNRSIARAYNAVKSHGYENICDLNGVKFYEWKGVGDDVATVIDLVLRHYGINPATPISGPNYMNSFVYSRRDKYYYFKS